MSEESPIQSREIPVVNRTHGFGDVISTMIEKRQVPAFIVDHRDLDMPVDKILPGIGQSVRYETHGVAGWPLLNQYSESIDPTFASPEHVDGAQAGRFIMLNTLKEGPDAEWIFRERHLTPDMQLEMRDHLAGGDRVYDFDTNAYTAAMPASVRFAPVVAEYRARLEAGQTIVFVNGYHGQQVRDHSIALHTHEVASVNEQGERIKEKRVMNVGYLATRQTIVPREPKKRWWRRAG